MLLAICRGLAYDALEDLRNLRTPFGLSETPEQIIAFGKPSNRAHTASIRLCTRISRVSNHHFSGSPVWGMDLSPQAHRASSIKKSATGVASNGEYPRLGPKVETVYAILLKTLL